MRDPWVATTLPRKEERVVLSETVLPGAPLWWGCGLGGPLATALGLTPRRPGWKLLRAHSTMECAIRAQQVAASPH